MSNPVAPSNSRYPESLKTADITPSSSVKGSSNSTTLTSVITKGAALAHSSLIRIFGRKAQSAPDRYLITDLPSYVIQEIAGYLTLEEQTKFGEAALTRTTTVILTGIKNARRKYLVDMCTHARVRKGWKALFGQELPKSEELETISPLQVTEKLHMLVDYIQSLRDMALSKDCSLSSPYFLDLGDLEHTSPQNLLQHPDMLATLLEGARLDNLARLGESVVYDEPTYPDHGPRLKDLKGYFRPPSIDDKEENLSAAEAALKRWGNTDGYLSRMRCTLLWTFPPELTLIQNNLVGLQIWNLQMHFLSDEIGFFQHLESLFLARCAKLRSLPNSIGKLQRLTYLNLHTCENFESLPDSIGKLQKLEILGLANCKNVKSLPDSIGELSMLKELDLSGTSITSLPFTMARLSLRSLSLPAGMLPRNEVPLTLSSQLFQSSVDLSPQLTQILQVLKPLLEKKCLITSRGS